MLDTDTLIKDALHQKEIWNAHRREVNAELRMIYAERMAPAEDALDAAVREAYDAGVSKSRLATKLGESRVTINERLKRTAAFAEPNRPKRAKAAKVAEEKPTYEKFVLDPDELLVKLAEDRLAWVKYEYDEVADAYIFPDAGGDDEVVEALVGMYDGPLYDEANAWLKANVT